MPSSRPERSGGGETPTFRFALALHFTRAAFSNLSRIAAPIPLISGTGQTITPTPASSSSRSPANNRRANTSPSLQGPQ